MQPIKLPNANHFQPEFRKYTLKGLFYVDRCACSAIYRLNCAKSLCICKNLILDHRFIIFFL